MLLPLIALQLKTIATVFHLDQKLLKVEVYEDSDFEAEPTAA